MENTNTLTRSKMAKMLKIDPETLRFYETEKLIKKPTRLANNYRIYDQNDVLRVQFIIMAKQLGFSLNEIKVLLNLSLTEKSDRKKIRAIAEKKYKIIHEKIIQLTRMRKTLEGLIALCQSNEASSECPILKSLYCKKTGHIL